MVLVSNGIQKGTRQICLMTLKDDQLQVLQNMHKAVVILSEWFESI